MDFVKYNIQWENIKFGTHVVAQQVKLLPLC